MKRYFIIGYMGSGKSTLGRKMAEAMNLAFYDLDHYIEQRYYRTIGELFIERGEEEFRQIEARLLREVATLENVFISTGGGTPCFHHNMEFMNQCGTTLYLDTPVDVLYDRLVKAKSKRPVIAQKSDEELRTFIAHSLTAREAYYRQAHVILASPNVADKHLLTPSIIESLIQQIDSRV